VVVWDTTMEHMTTPETLSSFGHEMGHYVLGHIPKRRGIILLQLLVLVLHWLPVGKPWLVARYGAGWGIRGFSAIGVASIAGADTVPPHLSGYAGVSMPCRGRSTFLRKHSQG